LEATQRATPPVSVDADAVSDRDITRPTDLLGRRLGPVGLELTCECFKHLDRYVELEVAGRDADAVHAIAPQGLPRLPRGPRQPRALVGSEPHPRRA
jgi:hypothetical protein